MRSFRKRIEREKGKTDSENSFPFLTEETPSGRFFKSPSRELLSE